MFQITDDRMSGFQIGGDPEPFFFVFFAQNADDVGLIPAQTFSPAMSANVSDDRIGLPDADKLVMPAVALVGLASGDDVNARNLAKIFIDRINLKVIKSFFAAKDRLTDRSDRLAAGTFGCWRSFRHGLISGPVFFDRNLRFRIGGLWSSASFNRRCLL